MNKNTDIPYIILSNNKYDQKKTELGFLTSYFHSFFKDELDDIHSGTETKCLPICQLYSLIHLSKCNPFVLNSVHAVTGIRCNQWTYKTTCKRDWECEKYFEVTSSSAADFVLTERMKFEPVYCLFDFLAVMLEEIAGKFVYRINTVSIATDICMPTHY